MKLAKRITPLDWLVISFTIIAFAIPVSLLFADPNNLVTWLKGHRMAVRLLAIGSCGGLLMWLLFGGIQSELWRWLPPFCLFPKINWVKFVVVMAVIVGTILGILTLPE